MLYCGRCDKEVDKLPCDCNSREDRVEKMIFRQRDSSGAWVVNSVHKFFFCSICKAYDCDVHGTDKVSGLSEIAAYKKGGFATLEGYKHDVGVCGGCHAPLSAGSKCVCEKPAKIARDYCEPHASQIWEWHQKIMRLEFSSMRKALDVMVTMDKEEWVREAVRASPDKVKVGDFGGEEKEKWFKAFVCEAAEMNVWERKIQIQLLRSFIR
jgi:hypothetical protein